MACKPGLIIEGDRIYLRRLFPRDANGRYCRWMADPEVTRYLEARFEKWPAGKIKNYIKGKRKNPASLFLAIVTKDTSEHIGNIKMEIDRRHNFADVALCIGEKSYWGKGIAAESIRLLSEYAFNKLNIRKLTAEAYSDNVGSIKAFKKAGFTVEGKRKAQYLSGKSYVDAVFLGSWGK